jgi:hypothetical protein
MYEMWIPDTNKVVVTASVSFDSYTTTPGSPPSAQPTWHSTPTTGSPPPKLPRMGDIMKRLAPPQPSPSPGGEDDGEIDFHDDDFMLPQAGGPDHFDSFVENNEVDPEPTRGNNQAARHREINADFDASNIVTGKRTRKPTIRANFTSEVFNRCFALALIKPTVGSKLSDLPPEPRNWKAFKIHPRQNDLQLAIDDEYNALISNSTWEPATPEEIASHEVIPAQWVWTYKGDA